MIKKLICGSFKLVHPKIWLLQKLPDFFRKVPQGNSLSRFFTVPSTWVSRAHDTRLSFKYFIPMAERQQRDAPVHIALAIYWFFLQEDIRVTCQTCQTRLSASVEHRNLPTDKECNEKLALLVPKDLRVCYYVNPYSWFKLVQRYNGAFTQ